MLKALSAVGLSLTIVFGAFLMEPFFPLGDWRWGVLAILATVPSLVLYRRQLAPFLMPTMAVLVVLTMIFWDSVISDWEPIKEWKVSSEERRESYLAPLRTLPVCLSDNCENKSWIVCDCAQRGYVVGRSGGRHRSDFNEQQATAYFRGCLVDKGLGWKPCNKDEAGCLVYATYYSRIQRSVCDY